MKKFYLFVGLLAAFVSANAQNVATFENIQLEAGSWWNGSNGSGGFSSGGFYFPNEYNFDWASWSGFSVSNMKDSVTAGWENQYSAIASEGVNHSTNYAVVYISGELNMQLTDPAQLNGFYVTNATYPYLSMKNGDSFSKKFGGVDGTDPDFFKLIISGTDIYGNDTGDVEFYLADFTSADSTKDYIVNTWKWVDLSSLGVVTSLKFSLESSDVGTWGINTPAYFCIDNFNATSPEIPEPVVEAGMEDLNLLAESFYNGSDGTGSFTSGGFTFQNDYSADWDSWSGFAISSVTDNQTAGWSNQYSAIPGSGALQSDAYAVAYVTGFSEIDFNETIVTGFYITNATYPYFSMKNGDSFSKKFGGANGTDPDWFKVSISGISAQGDTTGTINYYLADFRSENSNEDYIQDSWKWVDISGLGNITKLRFSLSSSDNGDWGMNTPAYFCIDQLNHQDLPPVVKNPIATIEEPTYPNHVYYVSLDSVFTDPDNPDSEMILKLENIDNPELLMGTIVVGGKPGEEETLLSLNITPGMTGYAKITISATSNGKKVYHTFEMVVSVPVSVGLIAESKLKVYPNPVQSDFFVEFPDNANELILYSPSGKIIYKDILTEKSKIRISELRKYPVGIYFLKIKTENSFLSKKIVKW